MTYIGMNDQMVKSNFIEQVRVAIIIAAIQISSEAPATANHANRVALANQVLLSSQSWATRFAEGAATLEALQTAPGRTDPNVSIAVASLWDAYAGIGA